MASSSVSQDDHDVDKHSYDFAIQSRRAKVRSARANRAVNNPVNNTLSCRGLGNLFRKFYFVFYYLLLFMYMMGDEFLN